MKNKEDWKEVKQGNILKFEEEGQQISGKLVSIEESKQFPNSYLVKINQNGEIIGVFVSNIVLDLIETNNIKEGNDIMIEYTGIKKTEDKKREYKTYKVFTKN